MARTQDTRQFNARSFRETVDEMRRRGEGVHDAGRDHLERIGTLHPNVDIVGKKPRGSHNAMVPGDKPGTYVLTHGISLPVLSLFDGTGSTAHWVGDFYHACEVQYTLLHGARPRYNPQFASGVVNDVYNVTHNDLPVVQVSQFESDERSAEQVRLLLPASMGNNTTTEDYDLGLHYASLVYADLWKFYGLKGYLTLTLDEIGRGYVTVDGVRQYLGQTGDFSHINTEDICRQLLERWHFFILQVPSGGYNMIDKTTSWWQERAGAGRVIRVEEPSLLAEVRAALVFASEARNPTWEGLIEFFQAGPEHPMDAERLNAVWRMIQPAQEHFGAQALLPSYQDIPLPGDLFAHFRHAWPIGHPRAGENITPVEA